MESSVAQEEEVAAVELMMLALAGEASAAEDTVTVTVLTVLVMVVLKVLHADSEVAAVVLARPATRAVL